MDKTVGEIAYKVAEEMGLVDKLVKLRDTVEREANRRVQRKIEGTFQGILRELGKELGSRYGEHGENYRI